MKIEGDPIRQKKENLCAREIDLESPKKEFRFSVCTLVTRLNEYHEMVQSFLAAGFSQNICEYLYINNSTGNRLDAYSGLNALMNSAKGEYVILCHQDICLEYDKRQELESCIAQLNAAAPNWGVFGNVGVDVKQNFHGHISHLSKCGDRWETKWGCLPQKCESLDGNFLVIKSATNIRPSRDLTGFHLYDADICLIAKAMGFSAWAVDFHLLHKSIGKISNDFIECARAMEFKLQKQRRINHLRTPCTTLYLGSSWFQRGFNDFRRLYSAKKRGDIHSIKKLWRAPVWTLVYFWLILHFLRPIEHFNKWFKTRLS